MLARALKLVEVEKIACSFLGGGKFPWIIKKKMMSDAPLNIHEIQSTESCKNNMEAQRSGLTLEGGQQSGLIL